MMAVNRPAANSTLTPSRARTAASPLPKILTRSVTLTADRVAVEMLDIQGSVARPG